MIHNVTWESALSQWFTMWLGECTQTMFHSVTWESALRQCFTMWLGESTLTMFHNVTLGEHSDNVSQCDSRSVLGWIFRTILHHKCALHFTFRCFTSAHFPSTIITSLLGVMDYECSGLKCTSHVLRPFDMLFYFLIKKGNCKMVLSSSWIGWLKEMEAFIPLGFLINLTLYGW